MVLHLLDVGASADAILALEPETTRLRMAEIFDLPWTAARPSLLLVIACHDIGKACPGFQKKWPELLDIGGFTIPCVKKTHVNHGFVSQVALATILIENCGWPTDVAELTADEKNSLSHRYRALKKLAGHFTGLQRQS